MTDRRVGHQLEQRLDHLPARAQDRDECDTDTEGVAVAFVDGRADAFDWLQRQVARRVEGADRSD